MKKITFLLATVLGGLTASAQENFYNFSQSTGTYTDLANPTSMNNGQVWDWDDFGPFTSPFQVSVFGQTFNQFGFNDDYFSLIDFPSDTSIRVAPAQVVTAYIMDRDFSFEGPSQSPVSYEVTGDLGSRILKMEAKNVGLEMEEGISSTSTLYLNYQVWFYEADNSVEFHYGNHNITDVSMLNEEGFSTVALGLINVTIVGEEEEEEVQFGYLDGTIANPTYIETTDNEIATPNLGGLPVPNTIYRFSVNPLAVKDTEKVAFNIYPNPTVEVLNLSFEENISKEYAVYDLAGRNVLSGTINSENNVQINVSSLQNGTYILKVGGTVKNFIKK